MRFGISDGAATTTVSSFPYCFDIQPTFPGGRVADVVEWNRCLRQLIRWWRLLSNNPSLVVESDKLNSICNNSHHSRPSCLGFKCSISRMLIRWCRTWACNLVIRVDIWNRIRGWRTSIHVHICRYMRIRTRLLIQAIHKTIANGHPTTTTGYS